MKPSIPDYFHRLVNDRNDLESIKRIVTGKLEDLKSMRGDSAHDPLNRYLISELAKSIADMGWAVEQSTRLFREHVQLQGLQETLLQPEFADNASPEILEMVAEIAKLTLEISTLMEEFKERLLKI